MKYLRKIFLQSRFLMHDFMDLWHKFYPEQRPKQWSSGGCFPVAIPKFNLGHFLLIGQFFLRRMCCATVLCVSSPLAPALSQVWVDLQETTFSVVAAAIFSYSSFSPPHTRLVFVLGCDYCCCVFRRAVVLFVGLVVLQYLCSRLPFRFIDCSNCLLICDGSNTASRR